MPKISLLPEAETQPLAAYRPLMVKLAKKDQLYSYFMPQIANGGFFLEARLFQAPGADAGKPVALPPPRTPITLLLTLPDETTPHPLKGKVVWVSHAGQMGQSAGVGVQFEDNAAAKQFRDRVAVVLAGILGRSEQRTQTL